MKILLIANWKANPATLKEANALVSEFKKIKTKNQELVVCPPAPFLAGINSRGSIKLGAQDVSNISKGAFTGEVAASMLKSSGASYCIIGHSERRKKGETSAIIAEKAKQLLKHKITPVLCVGEKVRGHNGEHFEEISQILLSSIEGVPKKEISNLVIAYEPLWAISTEGQGAMDPETIREAIIFIRKIINDHFGKKISSKVRVIYGGSVDPKNVSAMRTVGKAEGFLIGKASLTAKTFKSISDNLKS